MKLRNFSILILILTILFSSITQAKSKSETDTGYVILVEANRVYIDKGFTDGVRTGAVFSVYNGEERARIKVVEVFERGSAAELLTPYAQVEVGNQVRPYVKFSSSVSPTYKPYKKSRKTLAWFSLSVGLASGSGAIYYHWRDKNSISRTNQYNREKWFLAGTAGVALATSLFLFVRESYSNQSISLSNLPQRPETEVFSIIRRSVTDDSPYIVLLNHAF